MFEGRSLIYRFLHTNKKTPLEPKICALKKKKNDTVKKKKIGIEKDTRTLNKNKK